MKHRYLLPVALVATAAIVLFQSNASGPASNGNRATGAPGDGFNTCTSCHTGGSFGTVTIAMTIEDDSGNVVSEYEPNAVYSLNVSVSAAAGMPSGYGFQMIALKDSDDSPTNSFSNAGSGVQLSTTAGRQYAEHSSASATGSFTVDWTAPPAGSGDITFYLGGNAVNGNGLNSMDNAALNRFFLTEVAGDTTDTTGGDDWPEGLAELDQRPALRAFPIPVKEQLHLISDDTQTPFHVIDMNGRLVQQVSGDQRVIDVSNLTTGLYFLSQGQQQTKLIKL